MSPADRIHCEPYACSMTANSCVKTRADAVEQRGTKPLVPRDGFSVRHAACLSCVPGRERAEVLVDAVTIVPRTRRAVSLLPSTSTSEYVPRNQ